MCQAEALKDHAVGIQDAGDEDGWTAYTEDESTQSAPPRTRSKDHDNMAPLSDQKSSTRPVPPSIAADLEDDEELNDNIEARRPRTSQDFSNMGSERLLRYSRSLGTRPEFVKTQHWSKLQTSIAKNFNQAIYVLVLFPQTVSRRPYG